MDIRALMAMPQHTYDLTITCVEGWSTTAIRLRGVPGGAVPDSPPAS